MTVDFFFQAEDGIRDGHVTGVQTCALPIYIRNSVNFPELVMPRSNRGQRLAIANANVPNMLGQISAAVGEADVNILDMYNKSRGEVAYTLADVEDELPEAAVSRIRAVEGVLGVRVID